MKALTTKILFVFVLLATTVICRVSAQTTVQVVTKSFSGNEAWSPGMKLEINGENAEIHCTANTSNTIQYEVQLIAKHPDKEIAEADLNKLKWVKGRQGKKLIMRNYIELTPDDQRPESNLKAIYAIKIPEGCPLSINNYFGEIVVENTANDLYINSEFVNINLKNLEGSITIESRFGDVSAASVNGQLEIISNRSNITLTDISGDIRVEAVLAKIEMDKLKKITGISIEAEKSEISLTTFDHFRFLFSLDKTEFEKPDWLIFDTSEKKENVQKANFLRLPGQPLIQIKLTIGTLNLKSN